MKRKPLTILLALVMLFVLVVPAAAESQMPVGTCAAGFDEVHEFMDHDGDHEHHIGLTVDLNGNGLICVKHLANGLHVHADDVIR